MNANFRWVLAVALFVALFVDYQDRDHVKMLGTGFLTVAALLHASHIPDREPRVKMLMIGLIAASLVVLTYRLFIRHS